jgi:hypothetical protein
LAKSEGLGKAFHANGSKIAILISDKVYFQSKLVRSKEGHYNVIKRKLIHQEDIIINICISNISVQKQTLTTEGEIRGHRVIGESSAPLPITDQTK